MAVQTKAGKKRENRRDEFCTKWKHSTARLSRTAHRKHRKLQKKKWKEVKEWWRGGGGGTRWAGPKAEKCFTSPAHWLRPSLNILFHFAALVTASLFLYENNTCPEQSLACLTWSCALHVSRFGFSFKKCVSKIHKITSQTCCEAIAFQWNPENNPKKWHSKDFIKLKIFWNHRKDRKIDIFFWLCIALRRKWKATCEKSSEVKPSVMQCK